MRVPSDTAIKDLIKRGAVFVRRDPIRDQDWCVGICVNASVVKVRRRLLAIVRPDGSMLWIGHSHAVEMLSSGRWYVL